MRSDPGPWTGNDTLTLFQIIWFLAKVAFGFALVIAVFKVACG
jgi:hypothetical protein